MPMETIRPATPARLSRKPCRQLSSRSTPKVMTPTTTQEATVTSPSARYCTSE